MRKNIQMFFLLGILLLAAGGSTASAADAAVVSVSSEAASAGNDIAINVSITGNPGLAAWMFELDWDTEALLFDAATDKTVIVGDPFAAGTMVFKKTDSGVRVTWFSTTDNEMDGVLFTVHVRPAASASGTYPVGIACSDVNTINVKEEQVAVNVKAGSVTIDKASGGGASEPEPPPFSEPNPSGGETKTEPTEDKTAIAFTDVAAGSYYADAVQWAVAKGVTSGTSATTFSPDAPCTRGQTVTFLWRAAGSPEPKTQANPFTDVKSDAYYYKAVLWAVEQGVTKGTTATTFSPDTTVTRGQVVTFLFRAAGAKKADGANPFTDVKSGEYYTDAVLWAVAKGITNGTTATTFSPEQNCTRGQIVTFLYRTR